MGHIPEDKDFDEYMNASGEEWSKSEEPEPVPEVEEERVDRWGSPIPEESNVDVEERWGSEPMEKADESIKAGYEPPAKKSGTKWWIIVIAILLVLALCCLIVGGLIWGGLSIFRSSSSFSLLIPWFAFV
ncbi:MAG: hypothetical protein ACK2TV_00325 [Anaerolineales bacterium]|jgi:hypothetical protein